eukprot:3673923-Amphidinium_carterae.2
MGLDNAAPLKSLVNNEQRLLQSCSPVYKRLILRVWKSKVAAQQQIKETSEPYQKLCSMSISNRIGSDEKNEQPPHTPPQLDNNPNATSLVSVKH